LVIIDNHLSFLFLILACNLCIQKVHINMNKKREKLNADQGPKSRTARSRRRAATFLSILSLIAVILFSTIVIGKFKSSEKAVTEEAYRQNNSNGSLKYFDDFSFDSSAIKDPVEKSFILYGQELINKTSEIIGPDAKNIELRYSGNGLTCSNCHLNGGTRAFAAPFIGVWGSYPNFRKRENSLGTLEDRINGCMERSMNGKKMPLDGREMKAILAYMKFLNKDIPIGEKIRGAGFIEMNIPQRPANIKKGELVYSMECSKCHGKNGQGLKTSEPGGYLYPPLWGENSFNDGAGMHRLITAARFIKANMPYGVEVSKPTLTDDEAYDVAAFINSFPRPVKSNKEKDYPNLKLKPKDCPYPPYSDTISVRQHQIGPFNFN